MRDLAFSFETVKVRMNQTKEGTFLTLIIQHQDVPRDLHAAAVGARFMVSMAQIGEDEQPLPGPDTREGNKVVQSAAMLCRDPSFQAWMVKRGFAVRADEDAATKGLRDYCGIESRAELKDNPTARAIFTHLSTDFSDTVFATLRGDPP